MKKLEDEVELLQETFDNVVLEDKVSQLIKYRTKIMAERDGKHNTI